VKLEKRSLTTALALLFLAAISSCAAGAEDDLTRFGPCSYYAIEQMMC